MINQLTLSERQGAILISICVAVIGLMLGLAGRIGQPRRNRRPRYRSWGHKRSLFPAASVRLT